MAAEKRTFSHEITLRFLEAMDLIVGKRVNGKKITAQEFGDVVGIKPPNLVRLRKSPAENSVTVENIGRLCHHYEVDPSWLITGVEVVAVDASLMERVEKMEKLMKKIDSEFRGIRRK